MNCDNRPLPSIFVKKNIDEAFIGNFMKKKHPALSMLIGKQETAYLCFSAADFKDLITNNIANVPGAVGLKIYFASYAVTGTQAIDDIVNAGYDRLLTLIFAPTADKTPGVISYDEYNDIGGNYFMIDPVNGGVLTISPADAGKLVSNYVNVKRPLLQQILIDAGAPATVTETKTLWISINALTNPNSGFIAEMDCQNATGITAYIGSHPKAAVSPDGKNKPIDWQLTIVFCLAEACTYAGKPYFYHFDIDDCANFPQRYALPMVAGGGDTLNPCPPANANCSNI